MRQVEVKLLVSRWLSEITKKINAYLAKGWKLQGAVVPVVKDGETSFLATLIREE